MNSIKLILLLVIQVLIWNYADFSQYLLICFLPTMLLCLPTRYNAISTMLIAFVLGFFSDFLSNGQLGLNSAALVLVAALRRPIITIVFGADIFARKENIALTRQGWKKMLISIFLVTLIYLLVYIFIDSAGMRPLWADALKFGISLVVSCIVSLYIASLVTGSGNLGWK